MKPLRVFAVLFALLSVSNFLKPMGFTEDQGFVLFGTRLTGTPNLVAGWSFGAFLAAYAATIWKRAPAALPMGVVYACYVSANLYLFATKTPGAMAEDARLFGLTYTAVALSGAWGAVALLAKDRSATR